jgi:hypothetical protein
MAKIDIKNGVSKIDNSPISEAQGADKVNGLKFRINNSLLEYSTNNGSTWNKTTIAYDSSNVPSTIVARNSVGDFNANIVSLNGLRLNLGEGMSFLSDENYFGTNLDARIIRLHDVNDSGNVDGGLVIEGYLDSTSTRIPMLVLRTDGTITYKGNKVWHAGNDGAGSGLDADLLGGVASTSFARRNADNLFTNLNSYSRWLNCQATPMTEAIISGNWNGGNAFGIFGHPTVNHAVLIDTVLSTGLLQGSRATDIELYLGTKKVWNDANFNPATKVDVVAGKQLSTEDFTTSEKTKLAGIATGANNYVHPSTHAPSVIVQDANNRFVTDTEKSAWNAKANAAHGNHVPTTETQDNKRFLRNDNTWQTVTPANIGAIATGGNAGGLSVDNTDRLYGDKVQFTQTSGNTALFPDSQWWSGLRMLHNNAAGYFTEMAIKFEEDKFAFRRNSSGTKTPWRFLWHDGNFDPTQKAGLSTATVSANGLMSASDKSFIDGLINNVVTTSVKGLMSTADKSKLDEIAAGATNMSAGGTMNGDLTVNGKVRVKSVDIAYNATTKSLDFNFI